MKTLIKFLRGFFAPLIFGLVMGLLLFVVILPVIILKKYIPVLGFTGTALLIITWILCLLCGISECLNEDKELV